MKATIAVCIGCKDPDPMRRRAKHRAGSEVAAMVRGLMSSTDLGDTFAVETYACLGRCAAGGRISFGNAERWTWLLEGIDPAADNEGLEDLLRKWVASPDGRVPSAERPETLKPKVLGRVPPQRDAIQVASLAPERAADTRSSKA